MTRSILGEVTVNDRMQTGYVYLLTELPGQNYQHRFSARTDAQGNARARRVRREIHDRLCR